MFSPSLWVSAWDADGYESDGLGASDSSAGEPFWKVACSEVRDSACVELVHFKYTTEQALRK